MDSTSSPERTSQDGNGHHQPPSPRSPCDDSESNGLSNGRSIQTQRAEHGPVAQPERQNTSSSTATVATTITTQASAETATSTYSLETASDKLGSSQPSSQPRYSVTNGIDVTSPRRPSSTRRRQGPLTAEQRRKASVIRRLGACPSCKKRRVACDPAHLGSSWDEVLLARHVDAALDNSNRTLSPAYSASKLALTQDPQEMDVDSPPFQQGSFDGPSAPGRTPLPSSPRLPRPANMIIIPGQEAFRADLQATATRIAMSPARSRYAHVSVLMVRWQDDEDRSAQGAIQELASVFREQYNYTVLDLLIPPHSGGKNNPSLWLAGQVTTFLSTEDQRDILKVFYYSGHSYLGSDRDMVLASSRNSDPDSSISWQGIQQLFENANADSLLLMDCAFYPVYQKVNQRGMLEVIAASAGEDPTEVLRRDSFTRILAEQLKARAAMNFKDPFTAASLHAKLVAEYIRFVQGHSPEKEVVTAFPTPFLLQQSRNKAMPSIPLARLQRSAASASPESPTSIGTNIRFTFTISESMFNLDTWSEWLRLMPEGVKDVKAEGPYR